MGRRMAAGGRPGTFRSGLAMADAADHAAASGVRPDPAEGNVRRGRCAGGCRVADRGALARPGRAVSLHADSGRGVFPRGLHGPGRRFRDAAAGSRSRRGTVLRAAAAAAARTGGRGTAVFVRRARRRGSGPPGRAVRRRRSRRGHAGSGGRSRPAGDPGGVQPAVHGGAALQPRARHDVARCHDRSDAGCRPGRRPAVKRWVLLLKVAVSLGFIGLLAVTLDMEELLSQARGADPVYLLACVLFSFLMVAASTWKWWYLLRKQGHPLPFRHLYRWYFIGYFYSNFLPSNVGGDVARAWLAGRRCGSGSAALISIFAERFTGSLVLLALALAMPFLPGGLWRHPAVWPVMLLALGLLAGAVALM
ncbi:MAG: flippase-like domain-containing protein, partial [Opitutae bacterium]|nr:flippase-like domain-containing protein [Opitutae bacterium]